MLRIVLTLSAISLMVLLAPASRASEQQAELCIGSEKSSEILNLIGSDEVKSALGDGYVFANVDVAYDQIVFRLSRVGANPTDVTEVGRVTLSPLALAVRGDARSESFAIRTSTEGADSDGRITTIFKAVLASISERDTGAIYESCDALPNKDGTVSARASSSRGRGQGPLAGGWSLPWLLGGGLLIVGFLAGLASLNRNRARQNLSDDSMNVDRVDNGDETASKD